MTLLRIFLTAALCLAASCTIIAPAARFPQEPLVSKLAGCGKRLPPDQYVGKVTNVTIMSGGLNRSYLISIPPIYQADIPTPIIFSYHGGNRNATDQLELDQLTNVAFNKLSFVVYPQGVGNRWQGVPGITTNDVQFTADILNHVSTLYCIDPARVSATGKSDGAGFCNILACDPVLSTRIAAFAPVSGAYYIPSRPCDPSFVAIPCDAARDSIPLLAFHGGNDTTISYSGGRRDGECLPTIPHFINQWARRDGLSEKNVTTSLAKNAVWYRYGEGSDAGLVGLVFESDIGHDWPSTAPNADNEVNGHHVASFNATPIILNFFARHPLV